MARSQINTTGAVGRRVYRAVMTALDELGLSVKIDTMPNEIVDPIPFDQDEDTSVVRSEYANRFWRVVCPNHAGS